MTPSEKKLVCRTVLTTFLLLALGAVLSAVLIIRSGIYNISATSQHLQPVYSLLEKGLYYSVRYHASDIEAPSTDDIQMVKRGAMTFHGSCVQCHGAPGVAPHGIGMGMQPVPGPLVESAEKWEARELYWIVRHGIKMSGMPAWEYRMNEQQLWEVVAFMQHLPQLSPAEYKEMTEQENKP